MKRGLKILLVLLLVVWSVETWIPVTDKMTIDIKDADMEARMVLVTDLHSCYYGKEQKSLITMIEKQKPQVILFSGDIFDDRLEDKNAQFVFEYMVDKYPCYYVTGNHEYWSNRADEMKDYLRGIGVQVLEGDCKSIELDGFEFDICGVDDPTDMTIEEWEKQLTAAEAKTQESHYKILLSHRPEKTATYERYDFDLILSGHAHAGQFRIPLVNKGVFAPDQGFMAEYINGRYELSNGSTLIVSRGLARESTPLPRFFNHPQLIVLEFK